MTRYLMRLTALALHSAVLAACSEPATQPETTEGLAPSPELAVASNSWITRANMPSTERTGLASAVVPNASGQSILYAIGGFAMTGGSLSKVQAYNVATNTWTSKASLPIAVYWTNGAGVIGGKIYVSGGETKDKSFRRDLYVYDPATNAWTRKRDMPAVTWGGVTAVLNDKLYVLSCDLEDDCYSDLRPMSLYRYDPATDQWTFLSFSPAQIGRPMGGFIGGKFYLTGNTTTSRDGGARLHVYDPATNTWTPRTPLSLARWSAASVTLNAKLYVFGGWQRDPDGIIRRVRSVSVYDPATDTWTGRASIPTERHLAAASRVFVDGQPRIELVGGSRPGNNLQYTP